MSFQALMNRFCEHIAYVLALTLNFEGFQNASYVSWRTQRETTGVLWYMVHRPRNLKGAIVEKRNTFGDVTEIGMVGRRVMHGETLAIYEVDVYAARVHSQVIRFNPPFLKLLVVAAADMCTNILEPRPILPTLYTDIARHITDFAKDHVLLFVADQRVHPTYHLDLDMTFKPAVRTASPQEALFNYVEVSDISLRPAVAETLRQYAHEFEFEEDGEDREDADFELEEDTVQFILPERIVSATPEDIVGAYIENRYSPNAVLHF